MKINQAFVMFLVVLMPNLANSSSQWPVEEKINPYLSFKGGWTKFSKITNNENYRNLSGLNVRPAIGLDTGYFSYELEWVYAIKSIRQEPKYQSPRKKPEIVNEKQIKSHSAIINLYLNAMPDKSLNPYIGAGIGVTKPRVKKISDIFYMNSLGVEQHAEVSSSTKFKLAPTYQLTIGTSLKVFEGMALLLDYRYLSTFGKLRPANDTKAENRLKTQSINLGFKLVF